MNCIISMRVYECVLDHNHTQLAAQGCWGHYILVYFHMRVDKNPSACKKKKKDRGGELTVMIYSSGECGSAPTRL